MRLRSNLFAFTAAATLQMSSSNALAQAAPTPPPAQPAPGGAQPPEPPGGAQTPPSPQPAPPPPAPATAPAAPEPPAEPAAPVAPSVQPTPAPLSEEAPATEAPARKNWREAIQFRVFADAYAGVNYNFPKPQRGPQDEVRAYDTANGFALSWVGADVSHPADPVGGTIGLRWGPTAERYAGCFSLVDPCDNQVGLQFVKQAFGSWKPGGKDSGFRLDLGKFDTIYGVEVAESQGNINYTRGLLYWLGHPLFHTGIRAVWDVNRSFEINALLVNGYNNTIDNNAGKTAGFQFKLRVPRDEKTEDDTLSAAIGYLVGPERDDTVEVQCADGFRFDPGVGCVADPTKKAATYRADQKNSDTQGLRHLIDLVVSARPADGVELVANADLGLENCRLSSWPECKTLFDPTGPRGFKTELFWGVMLAGRYWFSDAFALGARGEYLKDRDGLLIPRATGLDLMSGTLTLEAKPTNNLIFKLDNRVDYGSKQIFQKSLREDTGYQITTTLGAVVTTD